MTERWELATCRQVGAKMARDIRSHGYCREAAYLNSCLQPTRLTPAVSCGSRRCSPFVESDVQCSVVGGRLNRLSLRAADSARRPGDRPPRSRTAVVISTVGPGFSISLTVKLPVSISRIVTT